MILQTEVMGLIPTNAYFYIDDASRHGFLIDPGAEPEKLLRIIEKRQFIIEKILLTHGHFDHIGAVPELREQLHVPVCMHTNGKDYAESTAWNLSEDFGLPMTLKDVTYLADNSEITLNENPDFCVRLLSVPGHTTDGTTYYADKDHTAFVGDSIFRGSYGRTDLYGGDETLLLRSIVKKIFTLPDDTVLLSGHSEPTTVKEEKTRPWFAPLLL